MRKDKVIELLEDRWSQLRQSFEGLSKEKMILPAPDGGWSIKDILAHVRAWEEECLKYLPLIVEEQRLPRYKDMYGGINAFNAMTHEANKNLPLDAVIKNLDSTHERLLDYLRTVPDEFFNSQTRFRRRLAADTYNHYPEHTETIRKIS
jgi:hypothetical protein